MHLLGQLLVMDEGESFTGFLQVCGLSRKKKFFCKYFFSEILLKITLKYKIYSDWKIIGRSKSSLWILISLSQAKQ